MIHDHLHPTTSASVAQITSAAARYRITEGTASDETKIHCRETRKHVQCPHIHDLSRHTQKHCAFMKAYVPVTNRRRTGDLQTWLPCALQEHGTAVLDNAENVRTMATSDPGTLQNCVVHGRAVRKPRSAIAKPMGPGPCQPCRDTRPSQQSLDDARDAGEPQAPSGTQGTYRQARTSIQQAPSEHLTFKGKPRRSTLPAQATGQKTSNEARPPGHGKVSKIRRKAQVQTLGSRTMASPFWNASMRKRPNGANMT